SVSVSLCLHFMSRIAFLLVSCSPSLVDLHTSPTRRSSDLISFATGRSEINSNFRPILDRFATGLVDNPAATVTIIGHTDNTGTRSEEHTSELQSRENLVCRLLLEKKKDNMYA